MYNKVDASKGNVNMEKDIAKLWKEKDVIQKSFDSNKDGEHFTFFDGPPTANGKPHVGHILTRVMKDIIPRYKVMQGYQVLRKAGWDTHGLPVELEIEKKLGISGKPERVLLGRTVILNDYMDNYIAAPTEDIIPIALFNMKDYVLNTNLNMTIKNYEDNETDDLVTKAIMLVDGKVIDKNSLVTITKKNV